MPTPMAIDDIFSAGAGLLTDFAVLPFLFAAAIAGVGVLLYRKIRSASR